MVSTPSSRQRLLISIWPSMAAWRKPWRGPGSSERYIEGTWVILAARATLPMAVLLLASREAFVVRTVARTGKGKGNRCPFLFIESAPLRGAPPHHRPQRGIWWLPMEMHTFLISANTSKLYSPPSRPVPEPFTPPNGGRRSRPFWLLVNTMPASLPRG